MNCKTARLFAAALLTLSIAGKSQADSFEYNVDAVTLPGGPIELTDLAPPILTSLMDGSFQVTMSGDAYNDSAAQTFDDVLFLSQFAFAIPSHAPYTFNSGVWSDAGGQTLQVDHPTGFLLMTTDTNAPLSFIHDSNLAILTANDSAPYIFVGTIAPGQSQPFSFAVDMNIEAPFNLYGSFVSPTPVPEPSSLALAGIGAIALSRRCATPPGWQLNWACLPSGLTRIIHRASTVIRKCVAAVQLERSSPKHGAKRRPVAASHTSLTR